MKVKSSAAILNPFDQYDGDENRLTHALAVTLERSALFRSAFLTHCLKQKSFTKTPRIQLQAVLRDAKRQVEGAIPDLLLFDDSESCCIVCEVKVGAALDSAQLRRHASRSRQLKCAVAHYFALTGRIEDATKIEMLNRSNKGAVWHHILWTTVFTHADSLRQVCPWAHDLANYLEITATQLSEKTMGTPIKLTTFTGIPFKHNSRRNNKTPITIFEPHQAKRILLALMDTLANDAKLLADLDFPKGQPPMRRGGVEASANVWDYLSPQASGSRHTAGHHFTVGITDDHASAMLTLPNASRALRDLQNYAKHHSPEDFAALMQDFLKSIRHLKLDRSGFTPCIVMVQRRYRTQRSVYAIDGKLTFDLRTLNGQQRSKNVPALRRQPEWVEFSRSLLCRKNANVQFQIGLHFAYDHAIGLDHAKAADFFKDALRATTVFLRAIKS